MGSRLFTTENMKADDQALFTNRAAFAESLKHSLEQLARGIGFYKNADKTEFVFETRWGYRHIKWQDYDIGKLVHMSW